MITRRPLVSAGLSSLILCCGTLALAVQRGAGTQPGVTGNAASVPPLPTQTPALDHSQPIVKRLTPVASGPGVVVCDPVIAKADASAANLGSGASRWLQVAVGGQGEFGKTPPWYALQVVRERLKRVGTRVPLNEGREVVSHLGLTHLVTGEVSGNRSQVRLAYQLRDGANLKPLGGPIQLTGSPEAVVRALPGAARELCQRLGSRQPKLPDLKESAADLQFLGGMGWVPGTEVRPEQVLRLDSISGRSNVGAIQLGYRLAGVKDHPRQESGGDLFVWGNELERREPENAIIVQTAACFLMTSHSRRIDGDRYGPSPRALQKHPNNLLFNTADNYTSRILNNRSRGLESAYRIVRANRGSSLAWEELWEDLFLRQWFQADGFYDPPGGQDSSPEALRLRREMQDVAQQLTVIAPRMPDSWHVLARTALTAGKLALANQAIDRALRLWPDHHHLHLTALEIAAANRGRDKAAWAATVKAATAVKYPDSESRLEVAEMLAQHGETKAARSMLRSIAEHKALDDRLRDDSIRVRGQRVVEENPIKDAGPLPEQLDKGSPIRAFVMSRSGKLAAAGRSDSTIDLYDVGDAKVTKLGSIEGGSGQTAAMSFSQDDRELATNGQGNDINLWNVATRKLKSTLKGHDKPVAALAWSPDGALLVSSGHDATLRIWNTDTGQAVGFLKDDEDLKTPADALALDRASRKVTVAMSFSPNGERLATLLSTGTASERRAVLRIWEVKSRRVITYSGHTPGLMTSVAWSPDGRRLATAAANGALRVWDTSDGKRLRAARSNTDTPTQLEWLSSSVLSVGDSKGKVELWNMVKPAPIHRFSAHAGNVFGLAWQPKQQRLLSAGWDGMTFLWDNKALHADAWPKDGTQIPTAEDAEPAVVFESPQPLSELTITPDQAVVVSVLGAPPARIDNSNQKSDLFSDAGGVFVGAIASAAKAPVVALGTTNGVEARDANNGSRLWSRKDVFAGAIAVSPDSSSVATHSFGDEKLTVLDGKTGTTRWTVPAEGMVKAIAYSSDGTVVAFGNGLQGQNGFLHLLDAASGKPIVTLRGFPTLVSAVQFSADGKRVATGDFDGEVRLWEARSGKLLRKHKAHREAVSSLTIDYLAGEVLTSSSDGTVRSTNLETGTSAVVADLDQPIVGHAFRRADRQLFILAQEGSGHKPTLYRIKTR